MEITEKLTSLGATVLKSDISFCELHHLPVFPTRVVALMIIGAVCIALLFAVYFVARDLFIPAYVGFVALLIVGGIGSIGMGYTANFINKPSEYTIEVNSDTNMAELMLNFEVTDPSAYPILMVTPK